MIKCRDEDEWTRNMMPSGEVRAANMVNFIRSLARNSPCGAALKKSCKIPAGDASNIVKGGSKALENNSFDQIYQEYFDPVYRYVLSLSEDTGIAEEITRETFFRAMRSLNQFRGESSVKSWLCAIARNLFVSVQRRKKMQPIDEAESLADTAMGPEETLLHQDESMRVHRLLHHLDEPYREVFTLRTLGQLSFHDIGDIFGKSENWACVVYHRARAKIRQKMGDRT